jgi:prepilin-type N-terminal cleavage/methylation domain-containing protein
MRSMRNGSRGFSLAEVLIVIALLGILATVVLLNLGGSDTKAKESALKSNVAALRTAVDLYRADHGWNPCSSTDANYPCTAAQFRNKLTYYTRDTGAASKTYVADTFRFGPYLKEFPTEPFGNSDDVTIVAGTKRLKADIATAVAKSSATGGWYYEADSGNLVANLGTTFPDTYAGF